MVSSLVELKKKKSKQKNLLLGFWSTADAMKQTNLLRLGHLDSQTLHRKIVRLSNIFQARQYTGTLIGIHHFHQKQGIVGH
jgi:hypothetical protein